MNLKEFVSETLVEIQEGVQAAIQRTRELKTSGVINPVWGTSRDVGVDHVKEVKFDIAVTVSDKSSEKLGGGIKVIGLYFGGDASEAEERSHVSRIQFTVPIIHPMTEVHRDEVQGELRSARTA